MGQVILGTVLGASVQWMTNLQICGLFELEQCDMLLQLNFLTLHNGSNKFVVNALLHLGMFLYCPKNGRQHTKSLPAAMQFSPLLKNTL